MSNIVSAVSSACGCGVSREEMLLDGITMVPAGSVNSGLSVCGYQNELARLPVTYIKPQTYTEGMCPDASLGVGTMFPELVSIYK